MNLQNNIQNSIIVQQKEAGLPLQKQFNQQNSQQYNNSTASKQSQISNRSDIIKNGEEVKQKCQSGEECSRQKRIQIQNQQLMDQQKNILDEFIKYNNNIQKTSDDYISQRKQWNKSFDLSKNKKIISIKDQDEEQNIITIAQYMVNNSNKSFEEQINNSIHHSLRPSPKNDDKNNHKQQNQKENQNPITDQGIQFKPNTEPEQTSKQNTPLKIYKNNKIYKNQYLQKIQNEGNLMTQQSLQASYEKSTPKAAKEGQDNIKIKYIQTDLNSYKLTPSSVMQNIKQLNKERYDNYEKRQRASSVTNKRSNNNADRQTLKGLKKMNLKSRLNSDSCEIQNQESKKLPEIFQFEEVSQMAQNQIYTPKSIQSNFAYSKPIESLQDTGVKLSTYNQNFSTKSSYRQKDSADSMCQTEPNDQLKMQNKIDSDLDSSFLQTEYKSYISKPQYKNHGRRFRSQKRASSQMSDNFIPTNQASPTSFHQENQKQMENLTKTEEIYNGNKLKNQINLEKQSAQSPQQNENQLKQNNQFYQYYYDKSNNLNQTQLQQQQKFENGQEQNKKYLIGSILRKDFDNNKALRIITNPDQSRQGINSNNQSFNSSQQNEQTNSPAQIETDLAAYQYIEKLKREKKQRQEEDYKKFLAEKQKMNDQFNEFCIKKQLTNSLGNQSGASNNNNESQAVTNPNQIYSLKTQQRMQEISNKCQQIYEECISQLQLPPSVFLQPTSNQQIQPQQLILQNTQSQRNNNHETHTSKNIQIDPAAITLPRLSPLNSSTNNSTKFQNDDKRSISYQRAVVNQQQSNGIQVQSKSTRSNSNQHSSTKSNNSKPVTITMQRFVNENLKGLGDRQYFPSKKNQESFYSKASQQLDQGSLVINQTDDEHQVRQNSTSKQPNDNHNKVQYSKKKILKIKNHSTFTENKDTLSQQKHLNSIKANNSMDATQTEKQNQTDKKKKNVKSKQAEQNDEAQFAKKIDLNLNESLQKEQNLVVESIVVQPSNHSPTKNVLSPKSILKSPKNLFENPSVKNEKGAQDFTLGYDSQIQFYDQPQIPLSQPTIYSNLSKKKMIQNDLNQFKLTQIQANNSAQPTQFIREEVEEEQLNQHTYKFSSLQETDSFYRVQTNSVDHSIKYSQDFGQIQGLNENSFRETDKYNQLSPVSNKYSVQINQITEVSNTEDELSQQNTRNMIKGHNQGSKFTFLNSSSPDIQDHAKESLTNFSQKILKPMQIIHQSKILQDTQSPSQMRQNLIEQLSKINQKSNSKLEDIQNQILKNEKIDDENEIKDQESGKNNNILTNQPSSSADNLFNLNKQQNIFFGNQPDNSKKDEEIKVLNEEKQLKNNPKELDQIEKMAGKDQQIERAAKNKEKQNQPILQDNNTLAAKNQQKDQIIGKEEQTSQNLSNNQTECNKSLTIEKQSIKSEEVKQNQEQEQEQNAKRQSRISDKLHQENNTFIHNQQTNEVKSDNQINIHKKYNLLFENGNKKYVQKKPELIEESQYVIDLQNESFSNSNQSPRQREDQETDQEQSEKKINIQLNSREIPLIIINSSFS